MIIQSKHKLLLLGGLCLIPILFHIVYAEPNSPSIIEIVKQSTKAGGNGFGTGAIAGNVTEIFINGTTQTKYWAGFYGNLTGQVVLDDANSYIMYNWDLVYPHGEVYSATSMTVDWQNVNCGNLTTMMFWQVLQGISNSAGDSITKTFAINGSHQAFNTAQQEFNAGECPSTDLYENSSAIGDNFQEVIIWDNTNNVMIFASIIENYGEIGFNGENVQFQIMVPSGNIISGIRPYYFWVELE